MSSQHSNSFPPALSTSLALTLGALSSLAAPTLATAQTAAAPASTLGTVEVRSTRETPAYQPQAVQSPKLTQPLRDTPQSISVVPSELIREQNAQSLQEVLQNVPGITFTSGEGNLGWGDFFTIRGFSAEQAITIDGVRDGGMASRTDTFNLEQAEVYKGTGSVESGVSAVGGSVNLVSKEAKRDTFYNSSVGVGSDGYRRLTADLNRCVARPAPCA
jgi:catecholate siderophore receptor